MFSENGLVTTIAWGLDGKVNYALEGSIFVAGAAIQWLRDEMRLIDSAGGFRVHGEKGARDTNGCYVVPAFTGLGAPHWDQYARGTIVGITRGVNKYHIIRATLESIAYQVNDVLDGHEGGFRHRSASSEGGRRGQRQQFPHAVPGGYAGCAGESSLAVVETTAMGAAYLAGLAVGYWENKEDVKNNVSYDRVFTPEMGEEERAAKRKGWNKAVKYAFGWAKDEEEEE